MGVVLRSGVFRVSSLAAIALLIGCSAGVDNSGASGFYSTGPPTDDGPADDPAGETTSTPADSSSDGGPATSATSATSGTSAGSDGSTGEQPAECGNGAREGSEGCDGMDHGGQSCADFGFEDGILTCTPQCNLVTDACWTCGDGMLSAMESCDTNAFGGATCQSMGFGGGTLGCGADCQTVDTSGCTALPSCGDGIVNGGEQCDGNDLGGSSCLTEGFDLGQLGCTPSCTLDTSSCDYDLENCGQMGDFCVFDENDLQSTCCPAGVGGNMFGICDIFVCV